MDSVIEAGPCERTNQIDFDDAVAFNAQRKLYVMARSEDERPFFLTVSFTNPHDPYACPREHWDRYDHDDIDMPATGYMPDADLDAQSLRLRRAYRQSPNAVTDEQVRNARHAYYGQISYVDDKIGGLLKALDDMGAGDNTIILFTADHGDMLGEKGLWYKMSFFEESVRVPLIVKAPRMYRGRRVSAHVSLVDLLPTILDITDSPYLDNPAAPLAGSSLVPLISGGSDQAHQPVISEYFAEGAIAPCFMIRQANYKYIYNAPDPPQLYDLEADPRELRNLASDPVYKDVEAHLRGMVFSHQDIEALQRTVVKSQKRRRLVFSAGIKGMRTSWDYSPVQDASSQYMRNDLDLNAVERRARIASRC